MPEPDRADLDRVAAPYRPFILRLEQVPADLLFVPQSRWPPALRCRGARWSQMKRYSQCKNKAMAAGLCAVCSTRFHMEKKRAEYWQPKPPAPLLVPYSDWAERELLRVLRSIGAQVALWDRTH